MAAGETAPEDFDDTELIKRGMPLIEAFDKAEAHDQQVVKPQMDKLRELTAGTDLDAEMLLAVSLHGKQVRSVMLERVEKLKRIQQIADSDMEAALYVFTQKGLDITQRSLEAAQQVCDATNTDLLTLQ